MSSPMEAFPTALEVAAAIRTKQVSPTEVMDDVLARLDRLNPTLNAIIWIDQDAARVDAAAATDAVAAAPDPTELAPFHGVPMPVKDLYAVEGWPVTYGSTGASGKPATESGIVIDRLRAAGFVLAGLSNSPEFGTITATENQRHGITRNPWNTDHTPGGSSGGASAAVASGMYPIAHASDGGGSIRIPASCTGLVGLKVSRARVPSGVVSWEGASVQGVVSHTVADTAAVIDLLAVPDPLGWWHAVPSERAYLTEVGITPKKLRVASMVDSPLGTRVDPECVAAVEATLAALEDHGHEIVDVTPDFGIMEFMVHFVSVVNAGSADFPVDMAKVEPHNQAGYAAGQAVDSVTYANAVAALQVWSRSLASQWGGGFDLLVTPTMPIQPVRAGTMSASAWENPSETPASLLESVAYTALFNMSGLPAMSLPLHQAADSGLPIGVQLVGGALDESTLFRVAGLLEAAMPWTDRTPDLSAIG